MKYLSLSFCFFFFFFTTEAQQEKNFYYFGSKKVLLSQSTEKLYVRMKEGAAESKTNSLRRDFKLPEKAITTLQATNFMVINLNALNKNERTQIVSELKQIDGNIEISRPVLIAPDGKEIVIDEGFYVKLKQGITYQQLKNFATQKKCILNETPYKYDSKVFNLKAGIANNFDGLQMANVFFESGLFEYAEPDFRSLSVLSTTSNGASLENKLFDLKPKSKLLNSQAPPPNDPLFSYQWALKNTGTADQYNGIVGADINVMEAWDITKGDPLIKIAVIDEGIDRAHLDLISNIMPIGFGLVLSNATTGNILSNNRSHGTSCAGIIAAEANNNIGISGIAPLCKVIAVNITVNTGGTFGSNSQLANALDWSWNEGGADVLSNSWGGGVPSSLMKDAIHRAVTQGRGGKGSLVVFSSGNDDAGVSSPGIYSEVIGVGAMSMCYQRKSPSSCDGETTWGGNYGTALDISAPGVKIATTRVTGSGSAPNKDYNLTFNGTSSAAPMVSGVAALVLSINNNLTQSQVREILERTARKVGNYSYNFVQGQPNGSWSSELGHGMINAKDAVIKAQNPAFCAVKVATTTSLQVCSSGFVPLAVTNSTTGDTYTWRRDGNNVGTGISFNANQTGSYDVILNSSNSCSDTSYKIQVIVSPQEGQLVANAGRDTTISINAKIFLGGTPSGKGGTAIINPMRGFANDIYNNTLIRFDPLQPSMNFQIVKSEVTNDYTGAASTPFGLFMINKYGSIVKIDTANGNAYPLRIKSDVSINGMTYDATTGKIFAIGKLNNNILYEVNGLTGECTFLANVSGLPNVTISSISADNSGQLFGFGLGVAGLGASLIKINKVNGEATIVGYTGFQANYAQGGGVDPLTDELYQAAITSPFGNANFKSKGLWKLNKNTGAAILIGTLAEPYNEIDAVSFAAKEYKYQWSPVTNLSNPNDANPQFTGTAVGTYVYTLTVTDLCGNTTTDAVTIEVKCAPSIVYVNAAATGANDGTSWKDAFKNLQDVLTSSCTAITQVWVAKGTYYPDNGGGNTAGDRKASFTLKNNLAIYGGFSGTETSISQRNLAVNPTILSGFINNNDGHTYNVVTGTGTNNTSILNGFSITGGQANGSLDKEKRGGALHNGDNSSPKIINCIFQNNFGESGGAIYNGGNNGGVFINCVFLNNNSLNAGAIYNEATASVTITNCTIWNNGTEQIGSLGNAAVIKNSIIWGATNGISGNATISNSIVKDGYAGTGNLNADPLFVNAGDRNLRIQSNSPAINAGNNAANAELFDADGNARKAGIIDMGAYEEQCNASNILYVNSSATGANSGFSWQDAFTSLQDALSKSCTNTTQIWVAAGTYKPSARGDNMSVENPNDRNNTFLLRKDVKIYGGFAGTETSLTQRDSTGKTNTTILSGDIAEYAVHVVISAGDVGTAELNSFTIKMGNANSSYGYIMVLAQRINSNAGGGIYTLNSSPVFANLIISKNAGISGGGLSNLNSSPALTNVTITGNNATVLGGGLYNDNSSSVLTNVIISGNNATINGGGIYNFNSSPVLTNSIIIGNNAGKDGGGFYNNKSSLVLTNVTISGNNAVGNGGAILNYDASSPKIRNTIIHGNSSGIVNQLSGSIPVITHSLVQGLTDETNGNISGSKDPLFLTPLTPGLNPGGDYHLQSNASPVFNKGSNHYFNIASDPDLSAITKDLDGLSRQVDGIVDMGAYEFPFALPVTVAGYTAQAEESRTKLKWRTLTESNNKEFIISHSVNGNNFMEIGRVAGMGISSLEKKYVYYDENPVIGVNFYRLEQMDHDGHKIDLGIRTVNFTSLVNTLIKVYPNPVKTSVRIEFTANTYYQLELTDVSGKVLQQLPLSVLDSEKKIDMRTLASGVYFIKLVGNDKVESRKVVKE